MEMKEFGFLYCLTKYSKSHVPLLLLGVDWGANLALSIIPWSRGGEESCATQGAIVGCSKRIAKEGLRREGRCLFIFRGDGGGKRVSGSSDIEGKSGKNKLLLVGT
jgi:hypothetical protein